MQNTTTPRVKRTYGKRRTNTPISSIHGGFLSSPYSNGTLNSQYVSPLRSAVERGNGERQAPKIGKDISLDVASDESPKDGKDDEAEDNCAGVVDELTAEDSSQQSTSASTPQISSDSGDPLNFVDQLSSAPRRKLNLVSNASSSGRPESTATWWSNDNVQQTEESVETTERSESVDDGTHPSTPTKGVKRARAPVYSSTAKRTYSERRTYQDAGSKASGSPVQPIRKPDDESDSDASDEGANIVRDAHELSTIGTHSQFLEELQFSIEGLRGDLNMKRMTLAEIAGKMKDKDFVNKMKTTHFPSVLFTEGTKLDDGYCSFVLGIIISQCFDAGVGLAVSMISEFSVADYLVTNLLFDTEDIRELAKRQKLSKAIQLTLEELINDSSNIFLGLPSVSRSLVALRALRSLEAHGQIMPFIREKLTPFNDKFVDLLYQLLLKNRDDVNLKLIQFVILHLEFMLNGQSVESTLEACETNDPNPIDELIKLCNDFFSHNSGDQNVTTSIIQLLIVFTSNLKIDSEHGTQLYNPTLATHLLEHAVNTDNDHTSDLKLLCWGLLVNLTESKDLCNTLLQQDFFSNTKKILDHALITEPGDTDINARKQFDCQGYQCLAFGQLATHNNNIFTATELNHIKTGLSLFKNVVQGPGLQAQLIETLEKLQSS
jgi:hypothetical protein